MGFFSMKTEINEGLMRGKRQAGNATQEVRGLGWASWHLAGQKGEDGTCHGTTAAAILSFCLSENSVSQLPEF